MISLKAIFIGKKRLKALLAIIIISISFLSAADYRIGFVSESNTGVSYVDNFQTLLSFSSRVIENRNLLDLAAKRDSENERINYEKEVAQAIRQERPISDLRARAADKSSYSSLVIPLSLNENDLSFLSSSDEVAISYIKLINDLDELYYINVEEDDGLKYVEIYLDGDRIFTFLFSEFVSTNAEEEILAYLLLRYRGAEYALVRFSGNTECDIYVSSERPERYRNYIVLPFGLYHIRLASPGFVPHDTDLLVDETIEEVEFNLQNMRTLPLFISTIPYTDEIYYQGSIVRGGYVEETTYPFSVIVRSDGYEPRSLQSDIAAESLRAELLPSDLYSSERVNDKKGEFYTHLLITLLSFGGSVATNVVSNIYSLDYLAPLTVAFQGVSILELIMTLSSLFEYRDALSFGI